MHRAVTSLCSRTNITCGAEGTIVRFKQVNDKFIDSCNSTTEKKLSKGNIKWLLEVWKVFSRAVYIGLHSDESYFCVRIVSKPLGEAIMLNPELQILHNLGGKKKKFKTESPALGILPLCDLTHQVTSHKMKESSFGEKKNILHSQKVYSSPLCSFYFEVNF